MAASGETKPRRNGTRRLLARARRWVRASAANAAEVVRLGRLGPAYAAPFEVLERDKTFRLRRYANSSGVGGSAPLVLVPPLMLTAEIYDVSPELSAAAFLVDRGVDAWVVDFGAPEREPGGMARTLDDHVRAVSRAVDRVRAITGRDVHLAGYSQGGMFAYQAAAFRRSDGIASVITFGSPVDIHGNVPNVASDVVGVLARAVRPLLLPVAQRIEGLPGALTSTGFKLLTPVKEVEQLVDFVRKLSDRKALEKRESRRRFLGGEGFVAWPGPALRTFLDDFVVHNRMLSGGMIIDGRAVTLADITCPVLAFVGDRDTFARADAVHGITRAAPRADVHFAPLAAGHFGLVVGSRALADTWPTVVEWLAFQTSHGPLPRLLAAAEKAPPSLDDEPEEAAFDLDVELDLAIDVVSSAVTRVIERASDAVRDAGESALALRFQLPRLSELERMTPDTRVGASRALADRARRMPRSTFFLFGGRAFSYADADARVNHVVRGLYRSGVRGGERVLVCMAGRPSFLSAISALDRLGAVPVVVPPDVTAAELEGILARTSPAHVVADPEHAAIARAAFGRDVLVLGGGAGPRTLADGLVDMEAIDTAAFELAKDVALDAGRAADLAVILCTRAPEGLRQASITRHRWALSALGAAAACTLRPDDTVYSCLPLHHPAGLLVAVGSALASGARLALATRFDPTAFWLEARRYGATVVFYAGEMARALADAPPSPHERDHAVRLFAGSGMRADLWQRLVDRFGVGVLEFYAATTENVVLANASGAKVGSIGRPLPGSAELAVARFDLASRALARDAQGFGARCDAGEVGLVVGRVPPDDRRDDRARVVRGLFEPGDAWFVGKDLLRRDADGDFWFVDRVGAMRTSSEGCVSPREVEDALYRVAGVRVARSDVGGAVVVASEPLDAVRVTHALADLAPHARPRRVARLAAIPMTDGYQPERPSAEDGAELDALVYDEPRAAYSPAAS
ncbi:MAG TPA: AMP-binding protein [Byssovorax sp.]